MMEYNNYHYLGKLCIILFVLFLCFANKVYSIDCFKCVSNNGGNKACDDPFHNNFSTAFLESPCMGGRKGRDGLFPATSCIKIAGYFDDNSETITVRSCALDSGTLTTDTELIRMSHCGRFYYEGRYVHGCLQSCSDADACNAANSIKNSIINRINILPHFIRKSPNCSTIIFTLFNFVLINLFR